MKKYGLVSTCHVITGFIDGTWKPPEWATCNGSVTIEQLLQMKNCGHEISSHGDRHISEIDDFNKSIAKLGSMNLSGSDAGFAIPGSNTSGDHFAEFTNHLKKHNHHYIRGGWHKKIQASIVTYANHILYRFLGFQFCYQQVNKWNVINLDREIPRYLLPSLVIFCRDKPQKLIRFIENLQNKNKYKNKNVWLIIMLHGILDTNEPHYGKDLWCWSTEKFDILCAYLSKHQQKGALTVKTIASQFEGVSNV
jgi:peptidoglycan/xylan/chitin deacetylase (PgdA/CDA1 family)